MNSIFNKSCGILEIYSETSRPFIPLGSEKSLQDVKNETGSAIACSANIHFMIEEGNR